MWCRLLLVAIALTCTFQREIIAQPDGHSTQRIDQIKDVVCVLLLSGLQKGDLDSSVLEKLQRRNVNIDDMNNEAIREQCAISSHVELIKETTLPTTEGYSYELPRRSLIAKDVNSDEIKQNHVHNPETDVTTKNESTNKIVLKNFINLYMQMISKSTEIPETTITTTVPTTLSNENSSDPKKDSLDYINHMLLRYIAAQLPTTTAQPTATTEKISPKLHIDIISQKIKELLDTTHNKPTTKRTTEANVKAYVTRIEHVSTHRRVSDYINEYLKLTDNTKLSLRKNQDQAEEEEEKFQVNKNNINTELKPLPNDIMKEITEKVKLSVLEHLQTHNITPIMIETTTIVPDISTMKTTSTTNIASSTDETKPAKDTANVLENIIDLLQQLKFGRDTSTDRSFSFTQKKGTRNEFHGPINVLYPPLLPMHYAYGISNDTVNVTPMFPYPYNQFSIINNPVIQKSKPPQPPEIHNIKSHFESLSNFNLGPTQNREVKPPIQPGPLTIQTDVGQIPPIVVNVPNTMSAINHNIIMTTKQPIISYNEYRVRYTNELNNKLREYTEPNYYDMVRNNGQKFVHDRYPRREDQTERGPKLVPRNRQYYDEFYKDHINNFHGQGNKHFHPFEHNRDRFHEILERPDGWQKYTKYEKGPKQNKRLKVSSRQQVSLHDLKKRPRYEDDHFRNFLKTQKKVNDMLEKILATKTDADDIEIQ